MSAPAPIDLHHPSLYINRELSWLDFNWRVIQEAQDETVPLLERVKFLAIASSNLDEFFMIRVAGVRQQIEAGVVDESPDGMSPEEILEAIHARTVPMVHAMSECFNGTLRPLLEAEDIFIHDFKKLDKAATAWCNRFFRDEVFPVLTPLAIDPGHPFPHLLNRSLNLMVVIDDDRHPVERVAVIQVPPMIRRLVPIPTYKKGHHYALLGEIIAANADALFPGLRVKEWYPFRITRNADLDLAEDEASDLLKTIEQEVRRRRWGAVVRIEVDRRMPKQLRNRLMKATDVSDEDLYQVQGPLNLADFHSLTDLRIRRLHDKPFTPAIVDCLRDADSILDVIRTRDVFLHHPYDSFSSVVEMIEEAAEDPMVLAIKMTLYRTTGNSLILKALARAAENGKQVTAFVELKARFDEENNIVWAKALERAGVHVVYGIIGLKTHCKIAIVVRKEKKALRTYVHLSSGNYNEATARVYTDFGLMTARPEVSTEATELFNFLTGYSRQQEWENIIIAPVSMRETLLDLITREKRLHTTERPGRIIAKLNALVDPQVIRALYRASQAGVRIDLLVRGICCLKPGIPGVSDTITVRSIVGRFLEHSRAFVFGNDGDPDVYLSSADWMPRNLNRRVEAMLRITDAKAKETLLESILPTCLSDTRKSSVLDATGSYARPVPNGRGEINAQEEFLRQAALRNRKRREEGEEE